MRITVRCSAGEYPVLLEAGLLDRAGALLRENGGFRRVFILSDSNVWPRYGERLTASLRSAGTKADRYVFPGGEASKNTATLLSVLDAMADAELDRSCALIALGGGVTGDMGALAAALYMRGIPLVQMPTTLLAAVDASVGGKAAVDTEKGKNLIGVFYPPVIVLQDTAILQELPERLYAEGAAEMIKCGVIGDPELFAAMRSGAWRHELPEYIARCVRLKAGITERDEHEQGERMLLNLGHTFGHAIELCSSFGISHGTAVATGTVMAFRAAGLEDREILSAIRACGLEFCCPFGAETLFAAAARDKKRRDGLFTVILPEGIGSCVIRRVSPEEMAELIRRGLGT